MRVMDYVDEAAESGLQKYTKQLVSSYINCRISIDH